MELGAAPRVAVVSGSYGAGHDVVARELTTRLSEAGAVVSTYDVADHLTSGLGRALRWLYLQQLRRFPSSWSATVSVLDSESRATRHCRDLLSLAGQSLIRAVGDADAVVSTHPFASQVLGRARRDGALSVPVVTYLTDASVHRLWVSDGVDLHLAIHDVAALQARELGGRTLVVDPVVPRVGRSEAGPGWQPPWPGGGPVALLVGGSHGVGRLHEAARDVLAAGLMTPVVACGDNPRLLRRVAGLPGAVALGWRSDLRLLMQAADCVIQNAGGISSLESLAGLTPTLTYRPIPGHGLRNAVALERAGLVPFPRSPQQLVSALREVLAGRLSHDLPVAGRDSVDILLGLAGHSPTASRVVAA
jgi:processive 1,2-diacylglycerol beta-glucosyltransferase